MGAAMTSDIATIVATYGVPGGVVVIFLLWLRRRVSDGSLRITVEAATVPELKREIAQLRLDLAAARGRLEHVETLADAYLRHLEAEHDARRGGHQP